MTWGHFSHVRVANQSPPQGNGELSNLYLGTARIESPLQKDFNVTPAFVPLLKARFATKPSRNKSRERGCVCAVLLRVGQVWFE